VSAQRVRRWPPPQKARLAKSRKTAKHAAPKRGSSVNRKGRYGRLACKDREKRSMSAGARARSLPPKKARWAKVRKAAKKATSTKVASKPVSGQEGCLSSEGAGIEDEGFYCSGFFSRTSSCKLVKELREHSWCRSDGARWWPSYGFMLLGYLTIAKSPRVPPLSRSLGHLPVRIREPMSS